MFAEKASKDVIVKNVFREGTLIPVKTILAIMEGHAWWLVIPSSVVAHLVTKDPDVMRKSATQNQQYVIQTHVSMEVHVKRMEKGTIVFATSNTQAHSVKLTNARNVTLTPDV